jgi:DNA polymerase-4
VAPVLRERPVAVAAPGADRATVLALSAEAKAAGIERGMAVARAKKMCPDLILRPPNPRLYARASRALHEILKRYAPVIEPRGYGHAYLDLTGTGRLFGPAVDVARRIQKESIERIGMELAVGAAVNKLVSEAASSVAKEQVEPSVPMLLDVLAGSEAPFLAPQPVTYLPDLTPDIRERLDDYQLDLIGEIAVIEERQLASVFGTRGRILHQHSRGIDPRPVLPPEVRAEFRATHTLASDTNDSGVLHPLLRHLTERLGTRLRQRQLVARRITIQLAYTDYDTAKRSLPISLTALDTELYDAARRAFALARTRTVALRAVSVTLGRFLEANLQLDLWEERTEGKVLRTEKEELQNAIDRIRGKWGVKAVASGR